VAARSVPGAIAMQESFREGERAAIIDGFSHLPGAALA